MRRSSSISSKSNTDVLESPLKVVQSLKGDLRTMGRSLAYSKEDLDLYTHLLQTILEKQLSEVIYLEAKRFLEKHLKSEKSLLELIDRYEQLKKNYTSNIISDTIHREEMTRQFFQLKDDVTKFEDIHYAVKLEYIRFTHEQIQSKSRQPFMVA